MTIEKARKILGKEAVSLTDEEVQVYINTAEVMAEMAFDYVLRHSSEEK